MTEIPEQNPGKDSEPTFVLQNQVRLHYSS